MKRFVKILTVTLLFGGLWGLLEATLGTLLHLPFMPRNMFLASTTIMVPIAYFLMGACYKRSGTFRSVIYMGFIAGGMKALACLIFHLSFNPVFHILLESAFMAVAILVIRPKDVLSFKGLGTMILANTLYLATSTFIRVNALSSTADVFWSNFMNYTFMYNCVAILYSFAFGAALYGLKLLVNKTSFNFDKVKQIIYHPAFAGSVAVVALVCTLVIV